MTTPPDLEYPNKLMSQDEIDQQKGIEFFAASVNAWYATALEHDKSLLTLSVAGIGLLVTLLTTVGLPSPCARPLYIAALLSFLVCVIAVLLIFKRNKKHIEDILTTKQEEQDVQDQFLKNLDSAALISFGFGVLFSVVIGVVLTWSSTNSQETGMATSGNNRPTRGIAQDSYDGITSIKKSFTGVGVLQPKQPTTGSQTTAPSAPAQSTNTNATSSKK